jgi:hypothetical protein
LAGEKMQWVKMRHPVLSGEENSAGKLQNLQGIRENQRKNRFFGGLGTLPAYFSAYKKLGGIYEC